MRATGEDPLFLGSDASTGAFVVVVDGEEIGRFDQVTGLRVEIETETIREGGQNGFVHHLPGRMTWPNLVLRRGVTGDDALLRWLHGSTGQNAATGGAPAPTTMGITLTDPKGNYLRTWSVDGAIPVRWSGPELRVSDHEPPMEELEVAHRGFRVE